MFKKIKIQIFIAQNIRSQGIIESLNLKVNVKVIFYSKFAFKFITCLSYLVIFHIFKIIFDYFVKKIKKVQKKYSYGTNCAKTKIQIPMLCVVNLQLFIVEYHNTITNYLLF